MRAQRGWTQLMLAMAGCVGLGLLVAAGPAHSQRLTNKASVGATNLAGTWRGNGILYLPSGNSERANCLARFRRTSARSYGLSAVCATASARVQQSARVGLVSGNRYQGQFYNAEFGISGSIVITVHGRRLSATLNAGSAAARMVLKR